MFQTTNQHIIYIYIHPPFSNESMYQNQEKPKKTCWVIHEFTSREMLGDTRCAPQCCFSVNCHSDFWLNAPVPAGAPWFPIPKKNHGSHGSMGRQARSQSLGLPHSRRARRPHHRRRYTRGSVASRFFQGGRGGRSKSPLESLE